MRAGRKPGSAHPAQLAEMAHSKVVNAAYFSPATGGKVLTTCIGALPPCAGLCWHSPVKAHPCVAWGDPSAVAYHLYWQLSCL